MGQCNYCTMNKIKSDARKNKMKVTIRRSLGLGGVSVYVHSPKVKPNTGENSPDFRAWFMELTDRCCC